MLNRINVALVGTGRMGVFTSQSVIDNAPRFYFPLSHADAINSIESLNLVAIADVNIENLSKAKSYLGMDSDEIYLSPEEMIKNVKPELLCVATRTIGRTEIIKHAYNSGVRAVHTEKPLCNSYSEFEDLKRILENENFFLTWGAIRRFFSVYKNALEIVKSGAYGRLREVRVNFGLAPLFWTHPHSIDLILFAAEGRNIEEVQAKLSFVNNLESKVQINNDPLVKNTVITFEDGLVGIITQALGSDLILSCEEAEISIHADGASVNIYEIRSGVYHSSHPLQIDYETNISGTAAPLTSLTKCLEGNKVEIRKNQSLKTDIANSQAILFAIVQSHLEGGKPVNINDIDSKMKVNGLYGGLPA